MPLSRFPHVRLAGVSAVVPARAVNLEDELAYYDGNPDKARRLSAVSGLATRRIAPEGVTASDMCIQAAQGLLGRVRAESAGIGALLFVSHSPDYLLPASAAIQQAALGLGPDCAAMDMNVGCAGFVQGLWVAGGLIESGACEKVLLLVGDTPNRFLDPANRVTSPVFGDAGTAALLERAAGAGRYSFVETNDAQRGAPPTPAKDLAAQSLCPRAPDPAIGGRERPECGHMSLPGMSFLLGSDGGKHEALVIPGGGSRLPHRRDDAPDSPFNRMVTDAGGNPWTLGGYCQIWMDGLAIYSFGVSVVPGHIRRHLEQAGRSVADLDALLLHQANKVIIEGIVKKTGIAPCKVPYETLSKYGNLGSSSIPALICEHYGPGGAGESAPKRDVLLCGFGAGLTWASCLLSLEETTILPVREYAMPEHVPDRDERIAYWHGKFSGDKGQPE